jgi:hypothetical protein
MKQLVFLFLFLTGFIQAFGCDICAFYSGIQPNDFRSRFEYYFRFRAFKGYVVDPSGGNQTLTSKISHDPSAGNGLNDAKYIPSDREQYYSQDFRAVFFVRKRVEFAVNLPYAVNIQHFNNIREVKIGPGDATILAHYGFSINKKGKVKQRLFVGSGIKLPTGWKSKNQEYYLQNPEIWPGTGSFDGIFSLRYSAVVAKYGMQFQLLGKLTGTNKFDYQFGNSGNATLMVFRIFECNKQKNYLRPFTGAYFETAGSNSFESAAVSGTGGNVTFLTLGNDFGNSRMNFHLSFQLPVSENLTGNQLKNSSKFQFGFTFLLKNSTEPIN